MISTRSIFGRPNSNRRKHRSRAAETLSFASREAEQLERRQLLAADAAIPLAIASPGAEVAVVNPIAASPIVVASPVDTSRPTGINAGFEYAQNATGLTITKYTADTVDVTVPQSIGGVRVTEIGANAFNGRTDITRVTLPEGITAIGDYAFFNSWALKSVVLPQGLKTVGYAAFGNCIALSRATLPSTVSRLGDFAFTNCSSLTTMNLPEGMTSVGWAVFRGCNGLTSVTLPSTATSIAGRAFMGCSSLKAVVVPAAVTNVGPDVFTDCTTLKSVYFLGNAPSVGDHPFQNVPNATAYYMQGTTGWSTAIGGVPTKLFVGQFGDFTYKITNSGVTITKYKGISTDVTVPQFIGGIQVTELGIGTFQGRGDIIRVTLPQGLKKIGNNAFDGCGSLTSVNIPNGVTSIGDTAFIWCGSLKTLNLPASVSSIGIFWSFWGCGNLTAINVDPANARYASQDGILYNKEMTWLYWCPAGKSGAITLAPTVKTIGYHSFQDCTRITSVTIPASVTLIEDGVFNGCANLKSFYFLGNAPTVRAAFDPSVKATAYYMPDTTGWGPTLGGIPTQLFVGQFGDFTYKITNTGVTILKYMGIATNVTVPRFINGIQVTELGIGAFQGRGDITRVTLPQGLLTIGNNAFDGCGKLTSINIPNGVKSIGDTAFIWCGSLKTLNIPASVNSIGIFWSFWGCGNLTAINVDPANARYASQDGILYNKEMTWLYWCPAGKSGAITLAPTVKTIGYYSFQDCNRITSLTIPASVTLIEDGVFDGCANLRSFYFQGNAPTVRVAFDPSVKATAYYVRGTTGWGATLGGIPTATTPLAPMNLQWNAQTKTLSWSPPTSDGGSPVLVYRVRFTADDGRTWSVVQTTKTTSIRLQTPVNLNRFTFSVAAVNAAGVGTVAYLPLIFPRPLR